VWEQKGGKLLSLYLFLSQLYRIIRIREEGMKLIADNGKWDG
jgi:hypothetical protein